MTTSTPATDITRRDALKSLAVAPLAAAIPPVGQATTLSVGQSNTPPAGISSTPAEALELTAELGVWPESQEQAWGGYHPAPPAFTRDMLRTLARVFHEAYDLRERLYAIPGCEKIEPACSIIECLMTDAKAALTVAIQTASGKPADQQAFFSVTDDGEASSIELDGWRYDVEAVPHFEIEDRHYYRWSLSATEL